MGLKRNLIIAVCFLGAMALVLVWVWVNASSPNADAVADPSTAETADKPGGTERLQLDSRIASLESSLSSGDPEELSKFVAMESSEISEEFVVGVAELGLHLKPEDATSIGEQLWNVRAIDRDGNSWDLGLLVDESQTTLFYAELAETT